MGAGFLKVPELQIDANEAKTLAEAVNAVQEYYDWDASEETIIWVNLVGALIAVYGPRIAVLTMRSNAKKAEKKKSEQNPAGNGGNVYSLSDKGGMKDATP
jgi:sugar lactone lactonase YvrE